MKPLLYGVPLSPFVRKVRLVMALKNIDYDTQIVVPYAVPEGYEQINPLKKVPALKLGDQTLADSTVICHLLERLYPDIPLLPSDPYERAHCEWLEKYADYELSRSLTFCVFFERILKKTQGKETDEKRVAKALTEQIPPLLDYLEAQATGSSFTGSQLCLADLAIACQLINFTHGGGQVNADKWPRLAEFFSWITLHPVVAEHIKEEKALLKKLLPANDSSTQC